MRRLKSAPPCRTAESHGPGAALVFLAPTPAGPQGGGAACPSPKRQLWALLETTSTIPRAGLAFTSYVANRGTSARIPQTSNPRPGSFPRSSLSSAHHLLPGLPPAALGSGGPESGRQTARLLCCLQHSTGRRRANAQSHLLLHIHSTSLAPPPSFPINPPSPQLVSPHATTHQKQPGQCPSIARLSGPPCHLLGRFHTTNRSLVHLAVTVQLSGNRYPSLSVGGGMLV